MTSFLLNFALWCVGAAILSALGAWAIATLTRLQRVRFQLSKEEAKTIYAKVGAALN